MFGVYATVPPDYHGTDTGVRKPTGKIGYVGNLTKRCSEWFT